MILSQIANDSSHNHPKAIPAVKFSEIIDLYETEYNHHPDLILKARKK